MQVSVTFRNIEPTESLKAYAEEKLSHVRKVVLKPIEAHVILSVEKFRHTAEITLLIAGETLFSAEQSDDMYKSIDKAIDKLTRQARRSKEKVKGHHRGVAQHPLATSPVELESAEEMAEDYASEQEWSEGPAPSKLDVR